MNITRGRLISSPFLCRVILIWTMERPHTKIKYKSPKYCSQCKREVYHTTHSASSYWVDWYGTELKPICVDCYKR